MIHLKGRTQLKNTKYLKILLGADILIVTHDNLMRSGMEFSTGVTLAFKKFQILDYFGFLD